MCGVVAVRPRCLSLAAPVTRGTRSPLPARVVRRVRRDGECVSQSAERAMAMRCPIRGYRARYVMYCSQHVFRVAGRVAGLVDAVDSCMVSCALRGCANVSMGTRPILTN